MQVPAITANRCAVSPLICPSMNAKLADIIRLCLGHFRTPEIPLPPAQPTTRKERRAAQRKTGNK